jgi:hypothetical protein
MQDPLLTPHGTADRTPREELKSESDVSPMTRLRRAIVIGDVGVIVPRPRFGVDNQHRNGAVVQHVVTDAPQNRGVDGTAAT